MSLQVWLPLIKDFENQGLSDLKFSSIGSNTFMQSNGKIGSTCYYNNSNYNSGVLSNTKLKALDSNVSMFAWVKLDNFNINPIGIGGTHTIIGSGYPAATGMGFNIIQSPVNSSIRVVSVNTGDGATRTWNAYYGTTAISAGIWYHVGFTYDGTYIRIYVNGKLDATHTYTGQSNPADYVHLFSWSRDGTIATPTIFPHYNPIGSINDFRIYDHVLTPKEIKLLSQGLVAHYQLKGMGRTNYLKGAGLYTKNNPLIRNSNDVSHMNDSYVYHNDVFSVTVPSDGTYSFVLESDGVPSGHNTSGTVHTSRYFSMWLQNTSTGNHYCWGSYGTGAGGEKYGQFTIPAGTYRVRTNLYAADNVNYTVKMWNIKFIKGTYEPNDIWCPNSEDELYKKLGYGYKPVTLKNMVSDGSFENVASNWNCWLAEPTDTSQVKDGTRSLKLGGDALAESQGTIPIVVGHKYYGREYIKTAGELTAGDCRFEVIGGISNGEHAFIFGWNKGNYPEWTAISSVITVDQTPASSYRLRTFTVGGSVNAWVDSIVLIDLTASFGAGNEPDVKWCDENIPFFEGTLTIAGYETDVSGYGNHGTKSAEFEVTGDSPRYGTCYMMDGTSSIEAYLDTSGWTDATVSVWVKPSTFFAGSEDRSCVLIGGFYLTITTDGKVATYCYGKSNAGYHTSNTTLPLNTWSHLVATWNEDTKEHKLYINGNCEYTISNCSGVMSSDWQKRKYIGRELWWAENHDNQWHRPFTGAISDARIYATALSASDISDMYNVPASVTKDGKLLAYDFHENNKNSIDKNGVVFSSSFNDKTIPTYDMKTKILDDGTIWARIHHLDVTKDKQWFTSASEVAKCTNKHNRYSRMGDVNKFKVGNDYEFMLTYPSMKKTVPSGYTQLDYIEATGTQYIKTGVVGIAKWEFDIQFTNTTTRQLMGYGGNGSEYWGSQENGMYGLATWLYMNVASGDRDTIVHDYTGTNTLWVKNVTLGIGSTDVTSKEYQIFAINGEYLCKAKLYRCKCIKSGSLIRDFIPAKRNSDGAIGLIDVVNNVFYSNAGSGSFVAGYKKEYQWLDYIQTTGIEYIDTGYAAPEGFITEAVVEYLTHRGGYFVGSHNISSPYGRNGVGINTVGWEIGTGDTCPASASLPTLNTKYTVKASSVKGDSYIDVDGTRVVSTTDSSSRCTGNLYVFSNQYTIYHNHVSSSVKLYSLKIYQPNGTLVRDYVPCVSPSGVVGLYDKVENKFYGNNGSGNLIAGTTKESLPIYNRWIQTSSPSATSVSGYKAINTAWTAHNAGIRTHGTTCLYNCDTGGTWYAPIGQYQTWTDTQYIPAADGSSQTETELWVRTDRLSDETQLRIYNGTITAKDYIEL